VQVITPIYRLSRLSNNCKRDCRNEVYYPNVSHLIGHNSTEQIVLQVAVLPFGMWMSPQVLSVIKIFLTTRQFLTKLEKMN
jgi:hypothetical protein